jgi:ABC-type lipoprotein export system ATPase subunit
MTAHIECADLVRIFSAEGVEVQALQGLTLSVERGELTAIVGASGSGKSTLLSILSGLDVPTAGRATVAGHDLLAMSTRERTRYRRHTVGFVWQQTARNLLPYLTAAENIAMSLSVARSPRRARSARVMELLGVLGIDAMRTVNEQLGVTVLIVTHDQEVSKQVRRTVQIRDGRTSTEVLRSTRTDEFGVEQHHAQEFVVLDRVGRLQLPQEYITKLSMRDRVRLELETDHVQVHPTEVEE